MNATRLASPKTEAIDLSQDSLADLLLTLCYEPRPGVVRAVNEEVMKNLYLRDGNVVYATSNDPADRLDNHLLQQRMVSEEELDEIARERARSEERAGVLMIRRGLMAPGELRQAIEEQIASIALSLFDWHEGWAIFEPQDQVAQNHVRLQLPLRRIVFSGTSRTVDALQAVALLGGEGTMLLQSWDGEDLIDAGLDRQEFALLRMVDGTREVGELMLEGPCDPLRNASLLHAFCVLGLTRPVLQRPALQTFKLAVAPRSRVAP